MRGDSLRDLYAKGLALLGLSVLAGVGALVDYWPTRTQMPRVEARQVAPRFASVLPVQTLDVPAPVIVDAPPRRPAPVRTARALPRASVPTSASVPALTEAAHAFGAPPLRTFTPPAVVTDLPVPMVALSDLVAPDDRSPRFLSAATAEEDEGGFFSGAGDFAKKAGSSILTTGSKAGASIMGGLTFVGRSLKKLKIF